MCLVLGVVPIPSVVLDRCLWLIGLPWSQVGCSITNHTLVLDAVWLVRLVAIVQLKNSMYGCRLMHV